MALKVELVTDISGGSSNPIWTDVSDDVQGIESFTGRAEPYYLIGEAEPGKGLIKLKNHDPEFNLLHEGEYQDKYIPHKFRKARFSLEFRSEGVFAPLFTGFLADGDQVEERDSIWEQTQFYLLDVPGQIAEVGNRVSINQIGGNLADEIGTSDQGDDYFFAGDLISRALVASGWIFRTTDDFDAAALIERGRFRLNAKVLKLAGPADNPTLPYTLINELAMRDFGFFFGDRNGDANFQAGDHRYDVTRISDYDSDGNIISIPFTPMTLELYV